MFKSGEMWKKSLGQKSGKNFSVKATFYLSLPHPLVLKSRNCSTGIYLWTRVLPGTFPHCLCLVNFEPENGN